MFKSIVSNLQAFGKAVVTRIIGFIGGIFAIKPETVESAIPPVANEEVNDATKAKTEEKKEGLIKKACTAVKKAASAAIKAVQIVLQGVYLTVRYATPVVAYSIAWEYAKANGLAALFMALWNTGTIPYFIICALVLVGVGTLAISIEMLWGVLLYPAKYLLFPRQAPAPIKKAQPTAKTENITSDVITVIATIVTQQVVTTMKGIEDRLTGIETSLKGKDSEAAIAPEVTTTAPAEIVTPTTNLEVEVATVVDSSPAVIAPTPVEVAQTVLATKETSEVVEEAVDSSPAIDHPLSKLFTLSEDKLIKELAKTNMEDLKKIIAFLNTHVKAPEKIGSHVPSKTPKGEGKNILISRIKRQIQDIRAKNQVVAA
jgi:hypothetical protein